MGVAGAATASLEISSEFNPSMAGSLCGVGVDQTTGDIWVYACSSSEVQRYSTTGTFVEAQTSPGETANDVDLDVTVKAMQLDSVALPLGTLLFINGESGTVDVYAVNKATGAVLATLETDFGVSHVVGGAQHPGRHSIFLVQDRVPAAADENRVAEIDPITGSVENTFQIGDIFDVNYGDLDVCPTTGNLLVVSSSETRIAELTPSGSLVQYHDLPAGVSSLSGIAVDAGTGTLWVAGTGGPVWNLTGIECSPIFSDGFESGDTSRWSSSVGEAP